MSATEILTVQPQNTLPEAKNGIPGRVDPSDPQIDELFPRSTVPVNPSIKETSKAIALPRIQRP